MNKLLDWSIQNGLKYAFLSILSLFLYSCSKDPSENYLGSIITYNSYSIISTTDGDLKAEPGEIIYIKIKLNQSTNTSDNILCDIYSDNLKFISQYNDSYAYNGLSRLSTTYDKNGYFWVTIGIQIPKSVSKYAQLPIQINCYPENNSSYLGNQTWNIGFNLQLGQTIDNHD